MISRTFSEMAKVAQVAPALWAVRALWEAQGLWVAQVAQARCPGLGRQAGQQGPHLVARRRGRLLLHEEPLRLLRGLQRGELLKGRRPDVDNEEEGWLLMAATKIRREPRRLTEEQKERLKDPKFVLALKAVKPLVLEERRRQGVRRRTTR